MIIGAAQADVGVLVISARKGEFETGFDKGGQTREHTMLAKTLGVRQLIVLVNKMDDDNWSEKRYEEIKSKISPYLKSVGFNLKNAVRFLPASGITGEGISKPVPAKWNKDSSLLDTLDDLNPLGRKHDAPVRFPILDKYKDAGVNTVIGKLEAGTIVKGNQLVIMPQEKKCEVTTLKMWEKDVRKATSGENLAVGIKGVQLEDLLPGFVLCPADNVCKCVRVFDAQLVLMNLKSVFTKGFQCVLHLHTAVEEVTVRGLLSETDKKTKKQIRNPKFLQNGSVAIVRLQVPHNVCVELFSDYPQLGRFTLRDEGKTIGIGKVTDLPTLRKKQA
jgi:peptide chain release factor subunit 3